MEGTITRISSPTTGAAGETRWLAERQHGRLLQRLCQLVLSKVWKQSEALDHLQQPLGESGRGVVVHSLTGGASDLR